AGGASLCEEGANPHKHHTNQHRGKIWQDQQGQPQTGRRQGSPKGWASAKSLHRTAGEGGRCDSGKKDEVDESKHHRTDAKWRLHEHEIDIGEGADEGEQDAKADGEARPKRWILEMHDPGFKMRAHAWAGRLHARGPLHRKINQQRTGKVECGKEIEVGGEAEVIGTAADINR